MTLLPFDINDNYFALDIIDIVEIIPMVRIEKVVDSNPMLSGLINYRGQLIPIVDLKNFFYRLESDLLLSTRIIIYNYNNQLIGLIVEDLTDTIEVNEDEFIRDSEKLSGSNFIKSFILEDDKTIKVIEVSKIFDFIYKK